MADFCVRLFLLIIALHRISAECNDSVIFFGDLNIEQVPIDYLQVVSTIGVYSRVVNNIGVQAYRHLSRPDIFLLRQPTGETGAAVRWVIATLPENKKPDLATAAHQVWPDAASVLLEARFPPAPLPWDAPGWQAPGWSAARQCLAGSTVTNTLAVRCVSDVRTGSVSAGLFGQCSSGLWRVVADTPAAVPLSRGVLRLDGAALSHGRPVYSSGMARLAVDGGGLWRLQQTLSAPGTAEFVSSAPSERLEYVQGWRRADGSAGEQADMRVVCEGVPDPPESACAGAPCRNNGTCFSGAGQYFCQCRFDSVSVNCVSVRECGPPPVPVNGHLLYTSDLSLHGKAFYTCAVGYRLQALPTSSASINLTFAICDGSQWQGVPRCLPARARADIADALLHSCDFGSAGTAAPFAGGWCPGYRHSPVRQLETGGAVSPLSWQLKDGGEGRGLVVSVSGSGAGSRSSSSARLLARFTVPCVFVPAAGCLVFDFSVGDSSAAALSVSSSNSGAILWRSSVGAAGWTTATVPLAAGSWSLQYEVALAPSSLSLVQVDQVRVFGWNCTRTGRALFGSPDAALRGGPGPGLVAGAAALALFCFWY